MEKATVSNYGYHAVHIEINANCNMACTFCPYPIKDDKTTKLPMEDIKSVIDQIDADDKKQAFHSGGHAQINGSSRSGMGPWF